MHTLASMLIVGYGKSWKMSVVDPVPGVCNPEHLGLERNIGDV